MSISSREIWTREEKILLFKAIKSYGHEDINHISEMLPLKSLESISDKLNDIITSAENTKNAEEYSLSAWLHCGLFDKKPNLLPQALLFIHLFEKQPLITKNSSCDFR